MLKFLKSSRLAFTLLAVVVLLIFLHYIRLLVPIENLVIRIFSPIQHGVYSVGISINNFYDLLLAPDDSTEPDPKLEQELQRLLVENAQLKIQLEQSQAEAVQGDFLASLGFDAVVAKVIGRTPEPNFKSIILNKGSRDGIKVGLPLIIADGIIVGKINKVKANSSEAVLINDSRSRLAAEIQNETKTKGVVVGEHGLSLQMELIPQNEIISDGDVVLTSGVEPTIPRGLVIGQVSQVTTEANSLFQTVRLKSLVKINDLIVVSVLTSPNYD